MNKQRDENKMKLKRNLLLLVFMLTLALVLAACSAGRPNTAENSSASSSAGNPSTAASETEDGQEGSSAPEEQASADGDVLVAYFSHTGNTEEVAQQIAEFTSGTLAEIQRAEEYGNLQEEAETEILDGVHPEITVSAENVQDYDTIFVGYPIWWDEAPAMIATFLDSYDFSGKTIVPFCTSASDPIDNSLHIFTELCPDAVIAEGLTANNEEDIEPWLQELGLLQRFL